MRWFLAGGSWQEKVVLRLQKMLYTSPTAHVITPLGELRLEERDPGIAK